MELHKSDVNVESFIDSCVSIFHTPARGKDITIKLESFDPSVEASLPMNNTDSICFDKFKMSQVLRNFMSNAMKFTPCGGAIIVRACFIPDQASTSSSTTQLQPSYKTMSVKSDRGYCFPSNSSKSVFVGVGDVDLEVGSNRSGMLNINDVGGGGGSSGGGHSETQLQQGTLRISVFDSGAGISPENQRRLFKEIIQFNPEVLQGGGGSGFGLFICKGIVDLHGGSIGVFSEGTHPINTPCQYTRSTQPINTPYVDVFSEGTRIRILSTNHHSHSLNIHYSL